MLISRQANPAHGAEDSTESRDNAIASTRTLLAPVPVSTISYDTSAKLPLTRLRPIPRFFQSRFVIELRFDSSRRQRRQREKRAKYHYKTLKSIGE